MTKRELNRDIKRMYKALRMASAKANVQSDNDIYFKHLEEEFKPEFLRLYNADTGFEYMTLESIRIMLRLNVKHRVVPAHQFGLYIKLD